jgi:2-oxoglutarate ferredoxin oxidoreductase subunit delta
MFLELPMLPNRWPGVANAQALLPVIDIRSRTRSRLWVVCTMIEIDEDLCKGCDICISFCPLKVLETSDKINRKGYYVPVAANEDDCVGCRLCELLCPEFAIMIVNE